MNRIKIIKRAGLLAPLEAGHLETKKVRRAVVKLQAGK
jgi:hypothetical protein